MTVTGLTLTNVLRYISEIELSLVGGRRVWHHPGKAPQGAANDHGNKGNNNAKYELNSLQVILLRTSFGDDYDGELEHDLRDVLEPPGELGPGLNADVRKSAELDVAVRKSVRFRAFPGKRRNEFCGREREDHHGPERT